MIQTDGFIGLKIIDQHFIFNSLSNELTGPTARKFLRIITIVHF